MNKKRVLALLLATSLAAVSVLPVLAEEEEEKVTSLEDANEVIETYQTENDEDEWEEIYINSEEDWEDFVQNCRLDTWSQNKKVYLTQACI